MIKKGGLYSSGSEYEQEREVAYNYDSGPCGFQKIRGIY